MQKRRVVITGIGVIAPNGIGKEAFWKALRDGKSGISRITSFDVSTLPTKIAGQIKNFSPDDFINPKKSKTMGRQTQLGLAAATMAVSDANLDSEEDSLDRCSIIGTCNPPYDIIESEGIKFFTERPQPEGSSWVIKAADPFSVSSSVSLNLNFRGSSKTFTTSCTAGINSIGQGLLEIQRGQFKTIIAGGTDSTIFPFVFWSFCAAEIMSKKNDAPEKASRPFDKKRDRGIISEGAGIIILEELNHALSRGAKIYGEIIGYGESAFGIDDRKTRKGIEKAITNALANAHIDPSEIDYISAHAPSDIYYDVLETQAIKDVFGKWAYRIPVSSIKSMIGNPLSASGPLQVISALLSLKEGIIPPTINYEYPDPNCDLDYVPNVFRRNNVEMVLINSHGFHGTDASLIVRKYQQF